MLWASADKLRAQIDAAEYKHLVLGLIFLKFISGTFTEHQPTVLARVSDPDSDYYVGDDLAEHQAALVAIENDNDNDTLRGKLDRRFGRA